MLCWLFASAHRAKKDRIPNDTYIPKRKPKLEEEDDSEDMTPAQKRERGQELVRRLSGDSMEENRVELATANVTTMAGPPGA